MRAGSGAPGHRVQATVREFDPGTGSGSVFLDDGTVCPFGAAVFAASGLRLLRRGQRVAIRCGAAGAITALALATLPLPAEERGAGGGGPEQSRETNTCV
jgi:2-phospho-L-lactate guanylyltransferase